MCRINSPNFMFGYKLCVSCVKWLDGWKDVSSCQHVKKNERLSTVLFIKKKRVEAKKKRLNSVLKPSSFIHLHQRFPGDLQMISASAINLYYVTVSSIKPIFHGRCESSNSITYATTFPPKHIHLVNTNTRHLEYQ